MILTITLEDWQLDIIKDQLRVKKEDWGPAPTGYALRIMKVRQALNLRNDNASSVIQANKDPLIS